MPSFAFRVQAECIAQPPSSQVETCVGRYEVTAMRPEAAAGVARQLFGAELARRRVKPVSDIIAVEVLPACREPLLVSGLVGAPAYPLNGTA
jgi:hypothetical protein